MKRKRWFHATGLILAVAVLLIGVGEYQLAHAQKTVKVSLVTDKNPGPGALHGIKKVNEALNELGLTLDEETTFPSSAKNTKTSINIEIYAGLAKGSGQVAQRLKSMKIPLSEAPESLLIRKGPELNMSGQSKTPFI